MLNTQCHKEDGFPEVVLTMEGKEMVPPLCKGRLGGVGLLHYLPPPTPPYKGGARPKRCGFTIVELLLSVAIIGILAGVVGPILIGGIKSYTLVSKRKAALAETRLAMERMTTEIRLIPDTNSIDTWTASALQFDLPTEGNINYSRSGDNLMRGASVLAGGVTSINFTYLDQNGAPASAKADIKRIGVEFIITPGTDYGSLKIRNQIFPRKFASAYAGYE